MRDWVEFVQTRLGATGLPPERERDIVEELAGHLEDAEPGSAGENLVQDWPAFARQIRLAEENDMHSRVRTFWLPGLITGIVAALVLTILQKVGPRPVVIRGVLQPMVIYIPWLCILPFAGALGAYLSARAGASVRVRILTAIFPCVALVAPMCLTFPFALASVLIHGEPIVQYLLLFGQMLAVWGLLPAAALAVGALPVLGMQKASTPQRSDAAHA